MNRKLSSNFSPPSHPLPSVAILPRNIAPLTKWVLYVRLSIYISFCLRVSHADCRCHMFVWVVPPDLHSYLLKPPYLPLDNPISVEQNSSVYWAAFGALFDMTLIFQKTIKKKYIFGTVCRDFNRYQISEAITTAFRLLIVWQWLSGEILILKRLLMVVVLWQMVAGIWCLGTSAINFN